MKQNLASLEEHQFPGIRPVRRLASRPSRKIFYLVDSLNVGGTETQAVELARRIPGAGYSVTLGCLKLEGPLRDRLNGTPVELREFHPKGGMDTPSGLYQLLRLAAFLRRERFDVVHTHDLWSNLLGVPAARIAGVPAIVSSRRGDLSHVGWFQGKRRTWLRRVQNLGSAVLTNSNPVRDSLIADDGFAAEKLRVILNGVDTERFRGPSQRDRLFPGVTGKIVVAVGNMHSDVKGHSWLIAAAPAVVREFPDTQFVFAGDGTERPRFERQVAELGLTRNFTFLGQRRDVPEILASCDIAVLASRSEGMPNAVLEYMAAGLPVVATAVGGNRELLEDGSTGYLVPPEDPDSLADAILRCQRNPEAARRAAESGRLMVERRFSFDRMVREADELYSELLAGKKGRE
jgi:glycosyltransferase involved in cell wall biosynthesis